MPGSRTPAWPGTPVQTFLRLLTLLTPLLLTPLLVFMLADGLINLGGGEKDILMALPWLVWALLFMTFGIGQWKKQPAYPSWLARSLVYSVGALVLLWVVLLVYSIATTR